MRNAVNVVFCVLSFVGWIIFEMWFKDATTLPTFKIERGERKPKRDDKKAEEENLPLY